MSKRARRSDSPHSSVSESRSVSPTSKVRRSSRSSGAPILCSLPPTCCLPNPPTELADSRELESHYEKYHAHVCEVDGCRCVFPDERFLELHITETHDPIALLRMEKGEKIFACFVPTCDRVFSNPKKRRLHLIDLHGYPKEYFFSVTNKGIGGVLKKWGQGASMLRGEWKPRKKEEPDATMEDEEPSSPMDVGPSPDASLERNKDTSKPTKSKSSNHPTGPSSPPRDPPPHTQDVGPVPDTKQEDDLTASFRSMSLVPSAIRFGRGGHHGRLLDRGAPPLRNGGHVAVPKTKNAPKQEQGGAEASKDGPVLGGGARGANRGRGALSRGSRGGFARGNTSV